MSCLKCTCGCDGLTKEALAEVINATDRVTDFINHQTAQDMFVRRIYPDEPDTYQPQASGSRAHKKPAKPRAIKYLEYIKEARRLLANNQASEDDYKSFADNIDPGLADELCDCVDREDHAARAAVLEDIIKEYVSRLGETSDYKKFQATLCDAYKKKYP